MQMLLSIKYVACRASVQMNLDETKKCFAHESYEAYESPETAHCCLAVKWQEMNCLSRAVISP